MEERREDEKGQGFGFGFWGERRQGVMFCRVHGLQNSTSSLIWN